jgi:hypothetical protein
MRLHTWLALAALVLWTGCGDDDADDGDKGSSAPDTTQVSEALTEGVDFENGLLVKGSIPPVSAQTVMLAQDDDVLRLVPGETSLMALEVDNPEESEDPVESTLLQFEESDDHVEVTRDAPDGGAADPSQIQISFDVADDICEGLCNLIYEISMNQAVKLESGDVSKTLARVFELDCTDDGDPKLCEEEDDEPEDAGTNGGNAGSGGNMGGSTGTTTAARELRSALNAANTTACMCAGSTGSTCEEAPFDAAAVSCIETAVREDAELVGAASCLGNRVRSVASGCSCEQSCLDDVVPSALGMCTGVEAITTALDDCSIVTN